MAFFWPPRSRKSTLIWPWPQQPQRMSPCQVSWTKVEKCGKSMKNDIFGLRDLKCPRRSNLRSSGPTKSRSLSNFRFMVKPWKMTLSVIFSMSKLGMASFGLRGHGGQPQYAHDLGRDKWGLHAKFHCPWLKTVDLYKEQTRLQTKLVWWLYN